MLSVQLTGVAERPRGPWPSRRLHPASLVSFPLCTALSPHSRSRHVVAVARDVGEQRGLCPRSSQPSSPSSTAPGCSGSLWSRIAPFDADLHVLRAFLFPYLDDADALTAFQRQLGPAARLAAYSLRTVVSASTHGSGAAFSATRPVAARSACGGAALPLASGRARGHQRVALLAAVVLTCCPGLHELQFMGNEGVDAGTAFPATLRKLRPGTTSQRRSAASAYRRRCPVCSWPARGSASMATPSLPRCSRCSTCTTRASRCNRLLSPRACSIAYSRCSAVACAAAARPRELHWEDAGDITVELLPLAARPQPDEPHRPHPVAAVALEELTIIQPSHGPLAHPSRPACCRPHCAC